MENKEPTKDYQHKFNECYERFNAIFELTTAASKIIDKDLTILRANNALTELMGFSADELIGTQIMSYACEEDKHHWHELQKAMWDQSKPNFKLDACITKKDGSLAWVHVTTIAFTENGQRFAFTILDDFTDWKKLQESEQRLQMALQYSKVAVFELDLTDRILTRSDGIDLLFGLSADERQWDEERLLEQIIPEDEKQLREVLVAIQPGQSFDYQARIKTADGVLKWINFQGRADKDRNSKTVSVLGTLADITRDKLAERQKDDFISIASHELKTPLTALNSSLQLLERAKHTLAPNLAKLVEQGSKSMSKVTLLVDDLLNASRLNEGQLHLRKTNFNLTKAIDECCLHVTAGGIYNIITKGVKDVQVNADSERIQRVIVNFVNNAVKYAPKSKDIVIDVEQYNEEVKVSITDQGPGIAEEKLTHLFDRFYRVDETGGQYSGLGLGLYISAEIIRRHEGKIGVYSETGQGSTFWFSLPLG